MKQLIIVALMMLSVLVNAQVKDPPSEVTLDFCRNIYIQAKIYNNDNIRAMCYVVGRNLGYELSDIEVAIEGINKNKKFRDELQKQMTEMYRDKEMITLNLISIGMRAVNAKILAGYLVNKYVASSSNNNVLGQGSTSKAVWGLPEPEQLLKKSYKSIVDSLNKRKIDFKIDSTFGEGVFYGYTLRTNDGEYFFRNNYDVRTYGFQINESIENVGRYFINKGAVISDEGRVGYNKELSYYILTYKGYRLEINRNGDKQSRIVYEKR